MMDNNSLSSSTGTLTLEKNRLMRDLEMFKRELQEIKSENERYQQDRSSLTIELKQAQQTSVLIASHLEKLKMDKQKLREQLKKKSRELQSYEQ